MITGYPFWSDAAGPTTPTIYDPILKTAITTLTFRGKSRLQRLMGISIASGTRSLGNSIRLKIGNSLPTYRRITVPANAFTHDVGADQQIRGVNYFDLGGLPIIEGDAIELSAQGPEGAAGTGAFAGVLWIDDLEPAGPAIPDGNIVCLVHGALAAGGDAGTTLTDLSAVLDARVLENNRLYTPYMVIVEPEDQAVEACMFQAGKDILTCPPAGAMIFPTAPIQFSGLEYNSGAIGWVGQCAAAAGIIVYMYCIESVIQGTQPTNATPVNPLVSSKVPGSIVMSDVVAVGPVSYRGTPAAPAPRTVSNFLPFHLG